MTHRMQWTETELVEQIITGQKTATVSPLDRRTEIDEFNSAWEVGAVYTVYDGQRQPRCKVRLTEIRLERWGAIPEKLYTRDPAVSGDTTLVAFVGDHYDYFHQPGDDFEFLSIFFDLVEVI
jgi:uncharacterized protein YhfF